MVDGDEHRRQALAGDGRGEVGAPHRVHRLRDDGPVVATWATRRSDPRRGKQVVLAHEPQHPTLRGPHPSKAQPRPELAMTFAGERASGKDGADRGEQRRIRHRPGRTASPRWFCPWRSPVAVDGCTGRAPGAADQSETVWLAAA